MLAIERSSKSDLPKVIHFTDDEIETGVVIKSFLDICFHQEYQVLDLEVGISVIGFARKYEFYIDLDRIELALFRRMAVDPSCGHKYFFLAAILGNWRLCGMCIASLHDHTPSHDSDALMNRIVMSRLLDGKSQSLSDFKNIYQFGPEFTMSIGQAGDQARKGSLIDFQLMGRLFTQMMVVYSEYLPGEPSRELNI
jgi:hypothetical protein